MKWFFRYLLSLFCIFLVIHCTSDVVEDSSINDITMNVDIGTAIRLSASKLFQQVKLIPLELNANSPITKIEKVVYSDEKFYVLDKRSAAVLIFDKNGNFIHKIHNPGEDYGQINMIYDFCINPYTQEIELLSPDGKVVNYIEEEDKYVTKINLGGAVIPVYAFVNLTEDIVVFYSSLDTHHLFYYSRQRNEIIEKFLPNDVPEEVIWGTILPVFRSIGKKIYFNDVHYYRQYLIDQNGVELSRKFTFGDNSPPALDELKSNIARNHDIIAYIQENKYIYPTSNYYEDDNVMAFYAIYKGKEQLNFYYDKMSEKWYVYEVPFGMRVSLINNTYEDQFIGVLNEPEYIAELFPNANMSIKDSTKFTDITIEDNPVLVMYKLSFPQN